LEEAFNPRHWRAVAAISLSLLVLCAVAAVYLAPPSRLVGAPTALAAVPVRLTAPGETATFTFLNPSTGWAAASMKGGQRLSIFATGDGAKSWRLAGAIDGLAAIGSVSLRFFDRVHGVVVVGPYGFVYRTADGGRMWAAITLPDGAVYTTFSDPLHGWTTVPLALAGQTMLYATTDAGATWELLPDLPVNGYPVFRSPAEGWLAGPGGTHIVYTSPDGGESWEPHYLPDSPCLGNKTDCPVGSGGPGSVDLLPGHGAIALDAWSGAEFVSYDLGASWRYVVPPATSFSEYSDIGYEDSTHWWAIRTAELFKTADGGATWRVVSSGATDEPMRPMILDARHAWVEVAVQDASRLGQRANTGWRLETTSDGGLTWSAVNVPVPD
jgi:photosystem II stability/assembly factor-like uncharacterized protein